MPQFRPPAIIDFRCNQQLLRPLFWNMEENRLHSRISIRWRSVIVTEEHGRRVTAQGKTYDISVSGVSIVCGRNLALNLPVTVYLLVHPGDQNNPELMIEAQGKIMNSVLSGPQGGFRLGIQFTKFAGDSKQLLMKHLPKTVAPKPPPAPAAAPAEAAAPVEEAPAEETAPSEEAVPAEETAPAEEAPAERPAQ